jgi:hypothetical protein
MYFSKKQKLNNTNSSTVTSTGSGFAESVVSGIGAGLGASLGDRLVSNVLGNRTVNVVHRSPDCEDINKIYKEFSEKGEIPETVKEAYAKCNKGA